MADFGGFQIKTPQEVLAELQAQRQQIASLPPHAQRTANIQFQMSNLFGNPELKKARETETAVKAAQDRVKQNFPGKAGQTLDGQAAYLQEMFDAVKDTDPAAAAQIQTQLAQVDAERFERARLTNADARSERNTRIQEKRFEIEQERFGRTFDPSEVGYLIDPNDPKAKPQPFDLTDTAQAKAYLDARNKGMMELSQDQAFEMLGQEEARGQLKRMINNSTFWKKMTGYDAQNQYLDKASKMVSRFRVNPETGLIVMDVKRGLSNVAQEAKAAIRQGAWKDEDGNTLDQRATETFISDKLDEMIANDELEISQQDRALFESAVLNMGYVLARSLDSGGRLSDQDVNMAIRMLTGGSALFEDGTISVPANQLVTVLYDRALDMHDLLQPDSVDGAFIRERADMGDEQALLLREVRTDTLNKFGKLDAIVKRTLPDHMYKRVRLNYDPDFLTDSEKRDLEAAELEAELVERFRKSPPSHTIFRPDRELEGRIAKNQGVIYNEDGSVDQIIESPRQLAEILRTVEEGKRIRFRNSSTGEMQNLRNPNDP